MVMNKALSIAALAAVMALESPNINYGPKPIELTGLKSGKYGDADIKPSKRDKRRKRKL